MDVIILISIAIGLISLIILLTILSRQFYGSKKKGEKENVNDGGNRGIRRAAGVRNARRRLQDVNQDNVRVNNANGNEGGNDNAVEQDGEKPEIPDGKMGAKKRAKLEAKAEKKVQREAMEKEREDRKKKDQQLLEEADKQREKEKLDELKREEAEKKEREEREKREYEEYLKMKEAFSVEEEGFDENETDEENLLQKFIEYIKTNKVVILEDLAGHFNIKTTAAIDRINELQSNGSLTGVIDDRGKFIYISEDELKAVAKFVKQQGRVSVTDLVENSNRLINLNPNTVSVS